MMEDLNLTIKKTAFVDIIVRGITIMEVVVVVDDEELFDDYAYLTKFHMRQINKICGDVNMANITVYGLHDKIFYKAKIEPDND